MTTTFLVAGEDADMVIGFQSGDVYLALQRELPIGSPISVAYWLNEQYEATGDGIDLLCPTDDYKTFSTFQTAYNEFKTKAAVPSADIKNLDLYKNVLKHLKAKNIPSQALHIMISAILAEVVITDLIFQRKEETIGSKETTTKAKLGLAINFPAPLVLLPSLAVRKIALLIMYASNGDLTFPVRDTTTIPKPEPASIPAHGYIDFGNHDPVADDEIILNDVHWKFVAGAEIDQVAKTTGMAGGKDKALSLLVKSLNESEDETISQCKYKLDGTKLMITSQAGGAKRNEFKLGGKWTGFTDSSRSGATLQGGAGELKEAVKIPVPPPAA
jgi:hypothetical protein